MLESGITAENNDYFNGKDDFDSVDFDNDNDFGEGNEDIV